MDLDNLSDSKLFMALSKHKIDVGPITDTTRKYWLKKLKQLEKEKNLSQKNLNSSSDKVYLNENKIPRKKNPVSRSPNEIKRFTTKKSHTELKQHSKQEDFLPSFAFSHASKPNDYASYSSVSSRERKSSNQHNTKSSYDYYSYRKNLAYSDNDDVSDTQSNSVQNPSPIEIARNKLRTFQKSFQKDKSFTTSTPIKSTFFDQVLSSLPHTEFNPIFKKSNNTCFKLFSCCLALLIIPAILLSVTKFSFSDKDDAIFTSSGGEKSILTEERSVKNDEYEILLPIIKTIYRTLVYRSGNYECKNLGKQTRNMTIDEILLVLSKKRYELNENLKASLELIVKNPHWGITFSDKDGSTLIASINEIHWLSVNEVKRYPLMCKLKKIFISSFSSIAYAILIALVIIGIYFFLRFYYLKEQLERKKMFELVDDIIDIFVKAAEEEEDDENGIFFVIQEMKNHLIPLKERRAMESVWKKCLNFINENETRIQRERLLVDGELQSIWRWKAQPINTSKTWQAAFDNKVQFLSPLTPCLKIRNMFPGYMLNASEHIKLIKNAILDKCGVEANILHIVVDTNSKEGCVYLKCLNEECAGIAYKAIHGWWFNRKLVSVKYIRLERYHERFPDSKYQKYPLLQET